MSSFGLALGIKQEHECGTDHICDVCGYSGAADSDASAEEEGMAPELPQTGDASYTALYMAAAGILALCALLKKRA